ncbi:recombinase family protein [Kitasatospora sp. NPDC127116]|uniref:recombinase family protein n=1 Tax=Kitasatospora sp. NPDC127116 TaxID=3345367 RepID=UPI0036302AD3
MSTNRRVILAKRISNMRDEESESIEDQDKKLWTRVHEESGVEVVGEPTDENVSGDVDMENRPNLGEWLKPEGREAWDELWVTTQDRLSRDDIHFMAFVFRMIEWGKTVIVLDDPAFNEQMHSPEGRLILHAKALGPAKELERIKKRCQDSHDRRRWTTRWPGGMPKFGYRPVQRYEDGKVVTYIELDEDMVSVLHQMRKRMIAGSSWGQLKTWANASDIYTTRDRARLRRGKPTRGRRRKHQDVITSPKREMWGESGLRKLLTDECLLGYKKHKGKILYDGNGDPLRIAPPVFTKHEWDTLQAACAKRTKGAPRVEEPSPLSGATICAGCSGSSYHRRAFYKDLIYRYYNCGGQNPERKRCAGFSCRAEIVEDMLEVLFLQEFGRTRVTKRVWVPGSDNSAEVEDVEKRIKRLRRQDEEGDWDDDREGYRERMDSLKARLAKLKKQPVRRAGWSEEDQGMTFLQLWPTLDLEGRRKAFLDAGFQMVIGEGTCWPARAVPKAQAGKASAADNITSEGLALAG